jgi:hypothetical protein
MRVRTATLAEPVAPNENGERDNRQFNLHVHFASRASMPHRKTFRRYHSPGDLHELTFSCYRRMPLLTNDLWRTALARCLDAALVEAHFDLAAFVFMPEHVCTF